MHQHDVERAAPAWLTDGGTEDEVLGLLKTGKEAEVFIVERRTLDGSRSELLAHKRYRPTKVTHKGELQALGFSRARTFAHDAKYHEGRKFRYSREQRAGGADDRPRQEDPRRALARPGARHARRPRTTPGVTVPYPVEFTGDGLLMQLIGDDGVAAPRLVNAPARRAAAARRPTSSSSTTSARSPAPAPSTPTCRPTTCCGGATGSG